MNQRKMFQTKKTSVVTFTPAIRGKLQRKCACGDTPGVDGECADCREKRLSVQRSAATHITSSLAVPPIIHEVLSSPGQALDAGTRAFMEPRFGHDFSHVRVHTDTKAAESAQAVNALAYTVGQNVVFGVGQFAPDTSKGRELLAHELTHVVQQASGLSSVTNGLDGGSTDSYERAAHLQAKQILSTAKFLKSDLRGLSHTRHRVIQRYTVPGNLNCGDVVDWLNNNSPYAPDWSQTDCRYSFNGQLHISSPQPSDGGSVQLTVKGHNGLTVSVKCLIDRPEWTPSPRPNRSTEVTAWRSMRATLDAHEQQHKRIGQQWKGILQNRFRSINFTVRGSDQTDAMAKVKQKVADDQQQWEADAKKAQVAIDPFKEARLNCPLGKTKGDHNP